MGKISVEKNVGGIEGLCLITPSLHKDPRGYFMESYNQKDFLEYGIDYQFVQDNQSMSKFGVLRGLHYQIRFSQAKLVRVLYGTVFDVAVDLRPKSLTFGKWFGVELSSDNLKQLLIPKGFAHGFLVMSDLAVFSYKCDDFYHADDEGGIIWNDPSLGISWPNITVEIDRNKGEKVYFVNDQLLQLSEKDKRWPNFDEYLSS